MASSVVTKAFVLTFGLAYPSYRSYKAIQHQDAHQYAQWLIYWIVFSLFISFEKCFDHFVMWIPFYYEMKVIVILWLVSPATKGSTLFYAKYLHPFLTRREQEIDSLIVTLNSFGYSTIKNLFQYLFSLFLAFFGQIHYGVLEVIKRRYNLQEMKESTDKEDQLKVSDHPINTFSATKDLKKQQSSNSQPKANKITEVVSTSPIGKEKIATSSVKTESQAAFPKIESKGRTFTPEPGSYFDRYLKPGRKISSVKTAKKS